jgi:hypothetical protein
MVTYSRRAKIARTNASAEQITTLIQQSTADVPSLQSITVRLIRLPQPDADGCNWVAKPSALPASHPASAPEILYGVIADVRRQFNLVADR